MTNADILAIRRILDEYDASLTQTEITQHSHSIDGKVILQTAASLDHLDDPLGAAYAEANK